jgi:hypothetical protein
VGNPDLSRSRSLARTIAAGDADAIAGFRDAHIETVRRYCGAVCASDRAEDACDAAFREFVARVREAGDSEIDLDRVLLQATRSAAAGRFELRGSVQATDPAVCAAMPELLAAEANGELRTDPEVLRRHREGCARCGAIAAQLERAEHEFSRASVWIPSA